MKEMKVSILGFGMMGVVRAVAYEAVPRYYTNSPIKPVLNEAFCLEAEAAAASASGWKANTDMMAVINNPETEYVDICLPNDLHCKTAIAAFEAGKHVFCEKPLSSILDEGRAMAEAADAHPNQLNALNFIYRRCPANVYARKLVQSGKFGRLLEADMTYLQSWGGPSTPGSWRFDQPGGGALGDLGSHAFDMLYYVTGKRPVEIAALKATHVKQRKFKKTAGSDFADRYGNGAKAEDFEMKDITVDDAMNIIFTLPECDPANPVDCIGTLRTSRNCFGTENTHAYTLYFENGAIRWNYDDVNWIEVYDATLPFEQRGWARVCANRSGFAYPSFADGHMFGYRDFTVNACYENMLKIAGLPEVAPIATFRDGFNVQRTLEACKKAHAEKRWVALDEIQ
ncbi:MAG: Gfo/Idh/MocA family oxidoreductase [Thermoguttaceae bacterium]|nr:Gfo/Idh/MocA family oxidoreductase [Thermoguttaceae bacterium]